MLPSQSSTHLDPACDRPPGLLLAHQWIGTEHSSVPAGLLPALDRPLLSWVLESLWDRGVRRLLVTVDERIALVERWFELDRRFEFETRILPVRSAASPLDVVTGLPELKPAAIVQAAALRSSVEAPATRGTLPSISSLEDYRCQLLGVVRRRQWNEGLPGVETDCASIVESAGDRALGEANPRCFIGRGSLVDPAAVACDSVLHKGVALLGHCDLAGCVVMPGTVLRDVVARDAVLGFEAWANRLVQTAQRAARQPYAMNRGTKGKRTGGVFRWSRRGSHRTRIEQRLAQSPAAEVDGPFRECLVDWLLAYPNEA